MEPDAGAVVAARRKKGWRVEDLARIAEVATKTVENVERGQKVYANTLVAIANALGVEYDSLLQARRTIAIGWTHQGGSISRSKFAQELVDKLRVIVPLSDPVEILSLSLATTVGGNALLINLRISSYDTQAFWEKLKDPQIRELHIDLFYTRDEPVLHWMYNPKYERK